MNIWGPLICPIRVMTWVRPAVDHVEVRMRCLDCGQDGRTRLTRSLLEQSRLTLAQIAASTWAELLEPHLLTCAYLKRAALGQVARPQEQGGRWRWVTRTMDPAGEFASQYLGKFIDPAVPAAIEAIRERANRQMQELLVPRLGSMAAPDRDPFAWMHTPKKLRPR